MTEKLPQPSEQISSQDDAARRSRRSIFAILIVLALGVGFGKIVAVDSIPDRTIQNVRLAQIPKTLQEKEKALREKGAAEDRIAAELEKTYAALLRDAAKARPTLSANDRSRWLTIRALVEKDARVYRYVPVVGAKAKEKRVAALQEIAENAATQSDATVEKIGGGSVPVYAKTVAENVDGEFKYLPQEILRNCASPCPERWADKANRVDGQYEKRLVPFAIDKAWETPGWDSIDVVKHGLRDELYDPANPASGYLYSSKPTLLPAVMAAPYWVLNRVFGLSLAEKPFETTRILLVIYNLIPLGIAFFCLASMIDSIGRTDWARFYALAAALFGTFALTFVATLNNHLPGFVCVSISLWAAFQILNEGKTGARYFAAAGFFGAFAVVCDLPSLAFAAFLCGVLLVKFPRKTLKISVPLGLLVAAAFFATNFIAHQSFVPAYSQKRDHMKLAETLAAANENAAKTGEAPTLNPRDLFDANDWYYYNYYPAGRTREAKNARLSHWANRTGIDRGEPSISRYALHSTVGTRGVFSLTPIWFFSVVGFFVWIVAKRNDDKSLRWLAFGGLALTLVFFAFFLTRDQGDRNYGGMSCWSRWFFPLVPLLIPALIPVVEKLSTSRLGRFVAFAALFVSAISAAYPTWTPWTSPWLYQLAVDWGWMKPY